MQCHAVAAQDTQVFALLLLPAVPERVPFARLSEKVPASS